MLVKQTDFFFDIVINNFGSRGITSESKLRYKEDLLRQMEEDNERRKKQRAQSAEPCVGLNFTGRICNQNILTPNELNNELLTQISQNQELKAKTREVFSRVDSFY